MQATNQEKSADGNQRGNIPITGQNKNCFCRHARVERTMNLRFVCTYGLPALSRRQQSSGYHGCAAAALHARAATKQAIASRVVAARKGTWGDTRWRAAPAIGPIACPSP